MPWHCQPGDWYCIKAGGHIASTFKVIKPTVQWGLPLVTSLLGGSRLVFCRTLCMWHRTMVSLVEQIDVYWGPIENRKHLIWLS
jgi:hypothetical protein